MKWVCEKCFMPRETDSDKPPGICSMRGCYGHFVPEGSDEALRAREVYDDEHREVIRRAEEPAKRQFLRCRVSKHLPNVGLNDALDGSFDSAAGRSFDSRTERKRYYKEHQLRRSSIGEARRNGMEGLDHKCINQSMSFAGQKLRRSSAEKHQN